MREKLPVYATLEEACTALGVEPRSLSRAGFMATNLINDRRGRGDGRIKLFSDGKGGLVTNWKTGLTALFSTTTRIGTTVGFPVKSGSAWKPKERLAGSGRRGKKLSGRRLFLFWRLQF